MESDTPLEEMARTFIVYDNEFHYSLYELAGRKNISLFYAAVNSQYERFRTFINLAGKHELHRLYNEHEQIWNCIVTKDLDKLDECISHHLYDGFNSSMKVIREYPDYFREILNGEHDDIPESYFLNAGSIDDVLARVKNN